MDRLEGEVGLQDEAIQLSEATLAALREFALEKGVGSAVAQADVGAVDVVRAVQQHFDVKEKETMFHISHGDVALELLGLKRELGQTLDSTGLTIWRAADHLCEYVVANRDLFENKYVCELGCGLGVVAILLDKLNVNATIVATDGDDKAISLLIKNMNSNACSARLVAHKLWWSELDEDNAAFLQSLAPQETSCGGEAAVSSSIGSGSSGTSGSRPLRKFDLILAADVIYDDAAVQPLAASAAALLSKPGGQILLAFARRNVPIAAFWEAAESRGLAWEKLKDCGSEAGRDNEAIYRLFWQK